MALVGPSPSLPSALSGSPLRARCMRGYHRCGAAISTAASKGFDVPTQSPQTGVGPSQVAFFGRLLPESLWSLPYPELFPPPALRRRLGLLILSLPPTATWIGEP